MYKETYWTIGLSDYSYWPAFFCYWINGLSLRILQTIIGLVGLSKVGDFLIFHSKFNLFKKDGIWGLLNGKVACDTALVGVLLPLTFLVLLVSLFMLPPIMFPMPRLFNKCLFYCVRKLLLPSAVVVMVSAFAGVPAVAVVLTAFYIPEFPAVAKVSAAVPNAVHSTFCCWCF